MSHGFGRQGYLVRPPRSICLGCQTILAGAEDRCPCVDALDKELEEKSKAWEVAHRDDPPPAPGSRLGFVCFEGVLPMRASMKALSRLKLG